MSQLPTFKPVVDDRLLLKALIDEGLASGVIEAEPEAVIESIIADRKAS